MPNRFIVAKNLQWSALVPIIGAVIYRILQVNGITVDANMTAGVTVLATWLTAYVHDVATGANVTPAAVTPPPAPPQENKPSAQ